MRHLNLNRCESCGFLYSAYSDDDGRCEHCAGMASARMLSLVLWLLIGAGAFLGFQLVRWWL